MRDLSKVLCILSLTLWCMIYSSLSSSPSPSPSPSDITHRIDELYKELQQQQYRHDQSYFPKFSFPPLLWQQQEGVYESFVHLNFNGEEAQTLARHKFAIPDSNAFVTIFVAETFLEISELHPHFINDFDEVVLRAIKAITTFQDENLQENVPTFVFWPQIGFTEHMRHSYRAFAANLAIPLNLLKSGVEGFERILAALGLKKIAADVSFVKEVANMFTSVFGIPADTDDTGCAFALGAKLYSLRHEFPKSSSYWMEKNYDFASTLNAFVKYSYQPFKHDESDENVDVIDPRTYFWMHEYLKNLKPRGQDEAPVRFVNTWMQNIEETRIWASRHVMMPFGVNNVDGSVASNALFGIISSVVYNPDTFVPLFDESVQGLVHDTANLLGYILDNDLLDHIEPLILLYYPSRYNFYWFVSRIVRVLNESEAVALMQRFPVLQNVSSTLTKSMMKNGAEQLLRLVSIPSGGSGNVAYWDGFLGNADTRGTTTLQFHEDRVYSTSVAVNALLDTFTLSSVGDKGEKKLSWRPEVTDEIKTTVDKALNWLVNEAADFPKENTFFSASMKGNVAPWNYPL